MDFDLTGLAAKFEQHQVYSDMAELEVRLKQELSAGCEMVLMSNGGFAGLPQRLAVDSL